MLVKITSNSKVSFRRKTTYSDNKVCLGLQDIPLAAWENNIWVEFSPHVIATGISRIQCVSSNT